MEKTPVLAVIIFLASSLALPSQAKSWRAEEVLPPGSIKSSKDLPQYRLCEKAICSNDMAMPFAKRGAKPRKGIPDGLIVSKSAKSGIASAWYSEPTRRYDHGILGDKIEAGALNIKNAKGRAYRFKLLPNQVFEDLTPRLADINGDTGLDVITILSSTSKGGSIAVFSMDGSSLRMLAQTPPIGQPYRWLNVAGIADFNGDGKLEIAVVETPHIGGTLQFWQYSGSKLVQIARESGFSNHFIGSTEQKLSVSGQFDDNSTIDIAIPSADRRSLRLMGFVNGSLKNIAEIQLPNRIDKAITATGIRDTTVITVGLEDGSVFAIRQ